MPTIIDSLVVTLGLDPSGFKKGQKEVKDGLSDTRSNADQAAKDMEAAGKRAASFFGSIRTELLALVGVTLSAAGVKTFITSMTSDLNRLGIESKALDISAKALDGWERAAAAAGSSAERITGNLSAFQNTLTKIRTGTAQDDPLFGTLANFGAATGAQFDYANDNAEALMRKISANWGKLSKDAQRAFGAAFNFDNATQQGLADGSLVRDADRFASISKATDDATKKAHEFNRRLQEMKQNFSAAAQVLYEALIPYVEKLIPLIEKFGIWITENGPAIERFFSDSAREVGQVVDAVGGLQNALTILAAFVAGSWALKMLGGIARVGRGFGPIIAAMAAISAWDKFGEEEKDAKEKGISVGESLIEKKNQKERENQTSGNTPTDKIIAWWENLTKGFDGDNKHTAYGVRQDDPLPTPSQSEGEHPLGVLASKMATWWDTLTQGNKAEEKPTPSSSSLVPAGQQTSEPYREKIYPINEVIRGDDQKTQQESNRLLEGILSSIKKLSSILTDQDQPQQNVHEQAGYLLRDRPQQPAEAPKPTKAGAALLGWMQPAFDNLERLYNLPMGLLRSVATTESGGNQYAQSGAGAKGLFQFMDGTASDMGLKGNDVWDPMKSAEAAAKYLSQLLRQTGGDLNKALASYNWGPGNVQRKGLENAPAETQAYVPKVLAGIQVGAGANANAMKAAQPQQGNKTEINIGQVDVNSSASTTTALGADLQRTVQRNRLVTPSMSGQG